LLCPAERHIFLVVESAKIKKPRKRNGWQFVLTNRKERKKRNEEERSGELFGGAQKEGLLGFSLRSMPMKKSNKMMERT